MSTIKGGLYIVATPIGNLEDITARALKVLGKVELVLAEDTRHSQKLLQHYNITAPLQSCHEHNEQKILSGILQRLQAGAAIALISDAGTPLINDPGFLLVSTAQAADIPVIPIPGPSALIAALSASGLATDRFVYEGFLPKQAGARRARLQELVTESRTLIFYEAPHRVCATLQDMIENFGGDRVAVIAKELTKQYETIRRGHLAELLDWLNADPARQQGEFVLLVAGRTPEAVEENEARRVLEILLRTQSVKEAAVAAAEILAVPKNRMYDLALEISRKS